MKAPDFDFVVLGSGIAGLTFALHAAAKARVLVLCKATLSETNTALAQGGIAAVLDPTDSFEQHVQDTLEAGAGLCKERAVRFMVQEAPAAIHWLQGMAVGFDKNEAGEMALGLEGGHSHHRIVHVKDHTGHSLQQALQEAVRRHPNISVQEHQVGVSLLTATSGTTTFCYGVQVLDLHTKELRSIPAQAMVLATGGSGQVYQHTTNPGIATGDGLAMATRAGARIQNMEFFQFHPTALYQPGEEDTFLISEALRGAGAELVLPDGSRFMQQYHPLGLLAPRDIVARAVLTEMQRHNSPCLYLDVRHLPEGRVQNDFPFIYHKCSTIGISAKRELIPVVPAAHYQCGGVETDLQGRTSIGRLYAIGEVACTGVHGANRLASNSLLEGVVFARSAAEHALSSSFGHERLKPAPVEAHRTEALWEGMLSEIAHKRTGLRLLMWEQAGIMRSAEGLLHGAAEVAALQTKATAILDLAGIQQEVIELQNLLTVAELIIKAGLSRPESAGGHFIQDDRLATACGPLTDLPYTNSSFALAK